MRAPDAGPDDRLDSWKAIAAYLNRDVSTVRRWEKAEGLPVHRHRHAARGSAYAYKSELSRWFASRRADLISTSEETPAPECEAPDASALPPAKDAPPAGRPAPLGGHGRWEPRRKRRWTLIAAAGAVSLTGAILLGDIPGRRPATLFHARDWILVGDIANRTGDSRLDGTIEYALQRELSVSRFVNVVPKERIDDTLRLMKKSPDALLDTATGIEVCLRDGGIRALLTGRIEKIGGGFAVTVLALDPAAEGATIAAANVSAPDESHLPDALHVLSDRLRNALGENLATGYGVSPHLERVTTSSLRALQLYSSGMRAVNRYDWRVGAELFQQAAEVDPDFAAAHIYLAHCLHNMFRPPDEYLPHVRRAAELADRTTDRERYFILGTYESFQGHDEKAAALFESLLQLYPDDFWGTNNLLWHTRRQQSWPAAARLAALRPNDFRSNVRAIEAAIGSGVDQAQIQSLVAHARRLAAEAPISDATQLVILDFVPAFEAWLANDVASAMREVDRMASRSPDHARTAAWFELAFGRVHDAMRLFQVPADDDRNANLALVAYFRGDRSAVAPLLRLARRHYGHSLPLIVWLSLKTESRADTEAFVSRIWRQPDDGHSPTAESVWADAVRAELRLPRDPSAVSDLERAHYKEDVNRARYFHEAEMVADVLTARGELAKSVAVLEDASRMRSWAFAGGIGAPFGGLFWVRVRAKLARVYRQVGRTAEADRIDVEVAKLLAYADPDFTLYP